MDVNGTSSLQSQIKEVQDELQRLTAPTASASSDTPLAAVPMLPNLARGSEEMWQIYQYYLREYERLLNLPSEVEFLQSLSGLDQTALVETINKRILDKSTKLVSPTLSQPTTTVRPPPYSDKVERAKLIAKHIKAQCRPPSSQSHSERLERIKELQFKLLDLEEQLLG